MDKQVINSTGENNGNGTINHQDTGMVKYTEKQEHVSKEITIKIVNGEKGKHYFIVVSTEGKETRDVEVFPKIQYAITNGRYGTKVKMHLDISYNISVSEARVKNMEEFMAKKSKGAELSGPVLKRINFIPKKETNTLVVDLEDFAGVILEH
jgi:hypothetical protein